MIVAEGEFPSYGTTIEPHRCHVYYDRITGRADENSVIGYFFGGGPVDGS